VTLGSVEGLLAVQEVAREVGILHKRLLEEVLRELDRFRRLHQLPHGFTSPPIEVGQGLVPETNARDPQIGKFSLQTPPHQVPQPGSEAQNPGHLPIVDIEVAPRDHEPLVGAHLLREFTLVEVDDLPFLLVPLVEGKVESFLEHLGAIMVFGLQHGKFTPVLLLGRDGL